jgi:hypothetical protein
MKLESRLKIGTSASLIAGIALTVFFALMVKEYPYFTWVESRFSSHGVQFFWELLLPALVIAVVVFVPLVLYINRLRRLRDKEQSSVH